jgi:cytochrome P450
MSAAAGQQTRVKPSDFPRDERFRDPTTPPFCDAEGNYHVFSYEDVMRALLNREEAFSRDPAPWLPPGVRHMGLDFMWVFEPFTIDGKEPRHDRLRSVVEPWFRTREVRKLDEFIRAMAADSSTGSFATGTASSTSPPSSRTGSRCASSRRSWASTSSRSPG